MLHVSIHQSGYCVDDLGLWPFAVKHATWLYNGITKKVTGLTPIKLLTTTHFDYYDLLRTHVWVCPPFMLDSQLQNDVDDCSCDGDSVPIGPNVVDIINVNNVPENSNSGIDMMMVGSDGWTISIFYLIKWVI